MTAKEKARLVECEKGMRAIRDSLHNLTTGKFKMSRGVRRELENTLADCDILGSEISELSGQARPGFGEF